MMQTILFFIALVRLITCPDFMAQALFQRKHFKPDSMCSFSTVSFALDVQLFGKLQLLLFQQEHREVQLTVLHL